MTDTFEKPISINDYTSEAKQKLGSVLRYTRAKDAYYSIRASRSMSMPQYVDTALAKTRRFCPIDAFHM